MAAAAADGVKEKPTKSVHLTFRGAFFGGEVLRVIVMLLKTNRCLTGYSTEFKVADGVVYATFKGDWEVGIRVCGFAVVDNSSDLVPLGCVEIKETTGDEWTAELDKDAQIRMLTALLAKKRSADEGAAAEGAAAEGAKDHKSKGKAKHESDSRSVLESKRGDHDSCIVCGMMHLGKCRDCQNPNHKTKGACNSENCKKRDDSSPSHRGGHRDHSPPSHRGGHRDRSPPSHRGGHRDRSPPSHRERRR